MTAAGNVHAGWGAARQSRSARFQQETPVYRRWVAVLVALMVFCAAGARGEEVTARGAMEIRAATVPELLFTAAEANGQGFTLVVPPKTPIGTGHVDEAMRAVAPALLADDCVVRPRAVRRFFVRFSLVGIVELRL